MSDAPLVTVFMPVYNRGERVRAAVESILRQTFENFELLVIDDGSTDDTLAVLERFDDPRIRIHRNERNLGVGRTRNRGLELARGRYLAVNDSDDTSRPDRLAAQVAFLRDHSDTAVVGAWARRVRDDGSSFPWRTPTDAEHIRAGLLLNSMMVHSSAVFDLEKLRSLGIRYDPDFSPSEDYDIFSRIATRHPLRNLPDVLVDYADHAGGLTAVEAGRMREAADRIRLRQLDAFSVDADPDERASYLAMARWEIPRTPEELDHLGALLGRMVAANRDMRRYDDDALAETLDERFFHICYEAAKRFGGAARRIWLERRLRSDGVGAGRRLKLLLRAAVGDVFPERDAE